MKKLSIMLLLFAATITANAQSSCEDKWKEIKRVNTSDTWKEENTVSSGKGMWKTIEYNNDYAYKLHKVTSTGYFYVQDHGFDKMVYYNNEKDAIRALFIWNKCGLFTELGKVK